MRLKRPLATDVGEREGGRSDVSLGDSWWCLIFCPGRRGKEKYDFFFRYYAGLLGGIPSVFFYFFFGIVVSYFPTRRTLNERVKIISAAVIPFKYSASALAEKIQFSFIYYILTQGYFHLSTLHIKLTLGQKYIFFCQRKL